VQSLREQLKELRRQETYRRPYFLLDSFRDAKEGDLLFPRQTQFNKRPHEWQPLNRNAKNNSPAVKIAGLLMRDAYTKMFEFMPEL
jgi:hypothetical protein